MNEKIRTGAWGEQAARRFLVSRGYRILEHNWRAGRGEIDIIAKSFSCVVFVEVKTRMSDAFGLPEESLTLHKQRMLRQTISAYLASHRVQKFRVDVIAITSKGAKNTLKHLKDIELRG